MTPSVISLAVTLFFIWNPIGNCPVIMGMIKDFSFERQRWIMAREGFSALLIALFFQFFGEIFLSNLHVHNYTISLCGGLLLYIVAINMVFHPEEKASLKTLSQEPFLVPIATPLLAGPSLLTIIMLFSSQEPSTLKVTAGIFVSWIGVITVLVLIPYLQQFLGKRGLLAIEQIMGMLVSFIGMEMTINGIRLFMEHNRG